MDNHHLQIAKFLIENREVAKMLATAIDTALESMDAYIQREINRFLDVAYPNGRDQLYQDNLVKLERYWVHKYNTDISAVAGVQDYNPHGCEGEQIYKFIQAFTDMRVNYESNYTQAEFNKLDEEDPEEAYNEKAYHEFTASGGCRD